MRRFFGRKEPGDRRASSEAPGRERETGFDWRSYDAVAEDYDRTHAPHTRMVAADLLAVAEVRSGERVLDIGAGTGAGTKEAAAITGPEGLTIGVEPAVRMLEVSRRARPELVVVAAEVLDLPLQDGAFDVAMACFTLPYFTKLDTALFDLLRALRPGGRLAVSTWAAGEDQFMRAWRELVEEAVGIEVLRGAIKEETPWAEALSVPAKLEAVLRDAGLRPVRVEKREYRFRMSREDLIVGLETEAVGRFVRSMLGPKLWEGFRQRVRRTFAERFPEHLVDLRDALLALGMKPKRG